MAFVDRGGQRLYYQITDIAAPWVREPATLLFHHGIGAVSGIWADWVHALADHYRIVRFDMRGYGRSDIPAADFPWSIDLLADDMLAVADAAGAERFHFVGESIGGTIGLYTALKHPARFLSLTMSNAGHVGSSIQRVESWRRTMDERGMNGWSDDFMADRFHPGALSPERWDWYARQQAADDRHAVLNALAVLVGMDLSADLPKVRPPVLILHPDASPFIPVAVAAALHAGLPDAELHVIGHAKHGLPFSHASGCATILRGFLARRFADCPLEEHRR
ncbi:MAG TPA: alpha/beta hydrolase [Stellaceae bacterium]|nr:alpha/beta hydrolase [Stellaceae bacterium]